MCGAVRLCILHSSFDNNYKYTVHSSTARINMGLVIHTHNSSMHTKEERMKEKRTQQIFNRMK